MIKVYGRICRYSAILCKGLEPSPADTEGRPLLTVNGGSLMVDCENEVCV